MSLAKNKAGGRNSISSLKEALKSKPYIIMNVDDNSK